MLLTRVIGLPVRTVDGVVLGKLIDLTARLGAAHPAVHRVGVGSRRIAHLVPWAAVATSSTAGLTLGDISGAEVLSVDSHRLPLMNDELLLVRDVLDTQIIDVVGHRMSRVSDVLLTQLPDGRMEVAAVDVGVAALCRRLGLSRLSARLRERAVDWRDLHLTSDRGHEIHLATTSSAVHELDEHALAELLTRLDVASATEVLTTIGPDRTAAAVASAHPAVGRRLILALEASEAAKVIERLPQRTTHQWWNSLGHRSLLRRRRFLRLDGWRLNRPPATRPDHQRPVAD